MLKLEPGQPRWLLEVMRTCEDGSLKGLRVQAFSSSASAAWLLNKFYSKSTTQKRQGPKANITL